MIPEIFSPRSIRSYLPEPVPEEVLRRILEAGVRASTTGNMQLYSLVVTTLPEIKERLAFQSADGHTGPGCNHLLRRHPQVLALVPATGSRAAIRQFRLVRQQRDRYDSRLAKYRIAS